MIDLSMVFSGLHHDFIKAKHGVYLYHECIATHLPLRFQNITIGARMKKKDKNDMNLK